MKAPENPNHIWQFIKSCFFHTNQPASTSLKHCFWLISLTFPSFSGVVRAPGNLSVSPHPPCPQPVGHWMRARVLSLCKEKSQNHKLQKIVTAKNRKEHTISPGLLKSNCAFYRPLDNSGLFGNFLTDTTQKTILPPEAVVLKNMYSWKDTKNVGTILSRGMIWLHIVIFLLWWNIDFKTQSLLPESLGLPQKNSKCLQ